MANSRKNWICKAFWVGAVTYSFQVLGVYGHTLAEMMKPKIVKEYWFSGHVVQIGICPMTQYVPQDIIYEVLEGIVAQAEGHDEALVVTSGGDEGCLPLIALLDATRL